MWSCVMEHESSFWGGAFSKWFWSKFTLISNGFCSRKVYFCSCFMPFARLKIRLAVTLQANCNKAISAFDRNLSEVINSHVWCEGGLLYTPLAWRECVNLLSNFNAIILTPFCFSQSNQIPMDTIKSCITFFAYPVWFRQIAFIYLFFLQPSGF